ncbi:MAG: DNA replication/repair protein RecF [Clostridia bacterium]|nr:DNA replication/repair protein RecF [Clostridia bacterium]
MFLNRLQLWNFRSYENLELNFPLGISLLTGENGQGKTNIVEAIYLLCTGKSHRTNREQDMIAFGRSWTRVRGENRQKDGRHTVDMVLQKGQKRRILVNGLAISRIGEMMGHISSVIFSPEDLNLVKDGPAARRRFMDIELSQVSKQYFHALNEYNQTLLQRNMLLKENGGGAALDVWDELLAKRAEPIIRARRRFCARLAPEAAQAHAYLSSGKETLRCEYKDCTQGADDVEGALLSLLEKNRENDQRRMFTTVGPHKDDLSIHLGDTDLRYFGSQGQQRTATLALKKAELEMMKQDLGEYPLLLLDDVLSELDVTRQKLLLEQLKDVQTIITAAQPAEALRHLDATVFRVKKGKVLEK